MPNVYFPSVPTRYDADLGGISPAIDIAPAREFGFLIVLIALEGRLSILELPNAIAEMRRKLMPIRPADYLVCVGDPILAAAAVHTAISKNGSVRLLRWNAKSKTYSSIEVQS